MFWTELRDFIKQYPIQVAGVSIALIAILVNVKGTRTLVKSLQVKGGKK